MKSEKVKEIKNALECCSSGDISNCNKCPYDKHPQGKSIVCWDNLSKDALILINELERENTKLKKYKFDWLNSEKMHLQADIEDTEFELYCANKAFKKVIEENQQLKGRIAELERENIRLLDSIETVQSNRCTTKCELTKKQLKQFAERLKDEAFTIFMGEPIIRASAIDKTLEEFVE